MAKVINIHSYSRSGDSAVVISWHFGHRDAKCQRAPVSEMLFDAISECPHLNVEEVDDGAVPTVPQIVEPQESNGVTLTIPIPVMATQR